MTERQTPSTFISTRAKKFRQDRGWSAREFAEKCREAGADWITDNVIENLERSTAGKRGRRDITVEDWLALSYALSVPPLALLLPIGESDAVEVVPGVTIHPDLARRWIDGDVPQVTSDRYVTGDVGAYQAAAAALLFYRDHVAAASRVDDAENQVRQREYTDGRDSSQAVEARRAYADALTDLAALRKGMRDHGVRPPVLPDSAIASMEQLGIDVHDERDGDGSR